MRHSHLPFLTCMQMTTTKIFHGKSKLGLFRLGMLKKCACIYAALFFQAQAIEQSWDEDIAQLNADSFQQRSKSESRLWAAGDDAIPILEKALASTQPEIALRASNVLDKILIGFKPDDPPELLALLVNFYLQSEKKQEATIQLLFQQKKYRIIHLLAEYAKSDKEKARLRSIAVVRGCAILEARMLVAAGKIDQAEVWLRRCGKINPKNQIPLAYFLVAQGRLEKELQVAAQQNGDGNKEMQMALHRASGNYQETLRWANQEKNQSLAATMEILQGNPLPYQNYQLGNDSLGKSYLAIAQSIRNGESPNAADINALAKVASTRREDGGEKYRAISMFLSLGLEQEAASAMRTDGYLKPYLFMFYALQERDEDVLKLLDLDPQKPDYSSYVKKQIEMIVEKENLFSSQLPYLVCWLERRGLWEIIDKDVIPHFTKLAETDAEAFDEFTELLFYQSAPDSPYYAPQTVIKTKEKLAPDDEAVWRGLLKLPFGNRFRGQGNPGMDVQSEMVDLWWATLKEWHPELALPDRFRLLMQIFRIIPDTKNAREAIVRKILEWHKTATPAEREEKIPMLLLLQSKAPSPLLTDICKTESLDPIADVVQLKQWEKATELLLKAAEKFPENPLSLLHASLCQHFAGNAQASTDLEQRFRMLVLGDSLECLRAAQLYATYNMIEPALAWNRQALALSPSGSSNLPVILDSLANDTMLTGKWEHSAAASEALLVMNLREGIEITPSVILLYTRNEANLARALSLKTDQREKCLAMLRKNHKSNIANAGLADDFFPSLRRAGFMEEHNAWFEESWQAMNLQHQRYPAYDNIANSMAWLAARAKLRLDEAKELSLFSLSVRPDQAAYLDTMAEIHFAKGDRKTALEWSSKALFMEQQDNQLFRQHYRFFFEPLP
jgi:hypothetical protein